MTATDNKYDVYHIEIPHNCQDSRGSAVVRNVKRNKCIKHRSRRILRETTGPSVINYVAGYMKQTLVQ